MILPQTTVQPKDILLIKIEEQIHILLDIHTQNVLPAGHRDMTATVKNADIPTLIRDGLERNTDETLV